MLGGHERTDHLAEDVASVGQRYKKRSKEKMGIILHATLCCNPELLSRDIIQASGLLIVSLLW